MADQNSSMAPARGVRIHRGSYQIDFTVGGKRYRKTIRASSVEEALKIRNEICLAKQREIAGLVLHTKTSSNRPFNVFWIKDYYARVCKNASARNIRVEITLEQIWELYEQQRGRCAISGVQFSGESREEWRVRPFFPSLDRIDNSDGYTITNCRWVCVAANIALNDFGEGVFRKIALGYATRVLSNA